MNKKDAVKFAKQFKWTEADAERAYTGLDLKNSTEQDLMLALIKFAGPELLNRQNLQKAQRGLVTRKSNTIENIKADFAVKTNEYKEIIRKERSLFVIIIGKFYAAAKVFGLKDPAIELLLKQYDDYREVVKLELDPVQLGLNLDSEPKN